MPPPEEPATDTLPALLARAVGEFGDAPAMVTARSRLTYRDLENRSRHLAKALLAAGVGKGSRVALLAPNSPLFVEMFFACARAGALCVPVSTLSAPAELAHVLRHCDAQILIAARRYVSHDYGSTLAKGLPSLSGAKAGKLRLPEAPYLRAICLDDPGGLPWASALADFESGGDDASFSDALLDAMEAEVTPADDAVLIYTSGSTALPKAVLHSQGTFARQPRTLVGMHQLRRGERILNLMPMFWVGGLNIMLTSFVQGACLVLPDGPSPQSVADAMQNLGADYVYGWPALRKPVREAARARGFDYSGVRQLAERLGADGQPVPPDHFVNMLGMTETFGPHSGMPQEQPLPEDQRGTSGYALNGTERKVVGPEGEELPPGAVGELWVRGGTIMKGFYKRERSEVFSPDGFYATQDLVRIDPDGLLYFKGRTGDMLKTRGANVSRLEVEAALRSIPGVAETVVCALSDEALGQRVVAAVVPEGGASLDEASLLAALRDKLSAYKLPRNILVIQRSDLIWTASGKIRVPEMAAYIAGRIGHTAHGS